MVNVWLLLIPGAFFVALVSSWFRNVLKVCYDAALGRNIPKGVKYSGESASEKAQHDLALQKSMIGFSIIIAFVAAQGRFISATKRGRELLEAVLPLLDASPPRLAFYVVSFFLVARGMFAECVQKPQVGNGNTAVIVRRLGFPAFWTVQTQGLLCTIFSLSAIAELALCIGALPQKGGPTLALVVAAPHRYSIFAAAQSLLVVLLFTAVMWGQDSWREKYVLALERQGSPVGWYQVLSHYTLPLGVIDLLVVRRPAVLRLLGLGLMGNMVFGACYGLFVMCLILVTKAVTGTVQYLILNSFLSWKLYPLVVLACMVTQCCSLAMLWAAVEWTI